MYNAQLKANNLCSLLHNHIYTQFSISLKGMCAIEKPSSKQTKPLTTTIWNYSSLVGLKQKQDRIESMVVRPCNICDA